MQKKKKKKKKRKKKKKKKKKKKERKKERKNERKNERKKEEKEEGEEGEERKSCTVRILLAVFTLVPFSIRSLAIFSARKKHTLQSETIMQ